MNCFFSSNYARQTVPPLVFRRVWPGLPLWLGMLLLAAAGAQAQGVDDSGHGYPWSGQKVILLQPVLWQQGGRPGPPPGPPPGPSARRGSQRRPGPPASLLERLQNLPPEEREKVLENNRRFQQLPPERQE